MSLDEKETKLDEDVLKFLRETIPSKGPEELQKAFWWVFQEGRFGDEEDAEMRGENIAIYNTVLAKLDLLPESTTRGEIIPILAGLPDLGFKLVKSDLEYYIVELGRDADTIVLNDALEIVRKNRDLEQVWYDNNPRTGGRNVSAYAIAKAVKDALNELDIEAHFGHLPDYSDKPSTSFGKIVEDALDFHRSSAHWEKPTKKYAVKRIKYQKKYNTNK